MEDVILFHKHCTLKTSIIRSRYTARWTKQNIALWCLFNSSIRKASCINIILGHLPPKTTSEKLSKEEVLLNYWDGSWIRGFGNAHSIKVMAKLGSIIHWAELLEKSKSMKKDKTILKKLGLMVRPDGIRLDNLT